MATKSKPKKTTRKTTKSSAAAKSPKSSKRKTSAKAAKEKTPAGKKTVVVDRRRKADRRETEEQSTEELLDAGYPIERRKKVNRRRQIDPTTCERDYTPDEIEFMAALDEYKRKNGRMFPTCSEILEVIRGLGYHKPGDPDPAPVEQAAASTEEAAADAIDTDIDSE